MRIRLAVIILIHSFLKFVKGFLQYKMCVKNVRLMPERYFLRYKKDHYKL